MTWFSRASYLALVALVLLATALPAQEAPKSVEKPAEKPPATPPSPAAQPADPNKPAAAAYAKTFDDWKTLLKDLRQLKVQFQSAPAADHAKMQEQWASLVTKGNALVGKLEADGAKAYAESPNEDPQLTRFLVKLAADALDRDEYESAARISQLLIDNQCGEKSVYDTASLAAYALNDFDKSAEYHKLAEEAGVVSSTWTDWNADPAEYKKLWEAEAKLRAAEDEKKDLPRVKLTTSKGDIVIELFEDQAPDTVGNFVNLVEKKFYDGLAFHRVLKGFMAQGGDPNGDGTGGPGYQIPCEWDRPDARMHFRGSLSMAHAGRDTGGSQFFLTFRPTPHLNKLHTSFGRVVEGMDVLARLQRRDPSAAAPTEPDKILKAEVIRKRNHEYVPKKTGA